MTLDEAIKHAEEVTEEKEKLCKVNDDFNFSQPKWRECAAEHRQLAEWLNELKRLKKQEPCDDAISREDAIKQCGFGMTSLLIANSLQRLPPVTPQPKMGRWILTDVEENRVWHCNCSECKKDPQDYIGGSENWWLIKNKLPKYCPNCGAKMQKVEE